MKNIILALAVLLSACTNVSLNTEKTGTLPMQEQSQSSASITPLRDEGVFFVTGSEGKYQTINFATGSSGSLIPIGYNILSLEEYDQFPDYFLLEKNNDIFAWNIHTKKIVPLPRAIYLRKNENLYVTPSLSEKQKFFLFVMTSTHQNKDDMSPEITASRSYFYDAASNTLTASNFRSSDFRSNCYKYDSLHQRFFVWQCGEGFGSALPLSIKDIATKATTILLTSTDIGLSKDDFGWLRYRNGLFVAAGNKILVLDPTSVMPSRTVFSTTGTASTVMEAANPYSMLFDTHSKTLIIGNDSNSIVFLQSDEKNQFRSVQSVMQSNLYPNFIYAYADRLFYLAPNNSYSTNAPKLLKVVSIGTGQIEKEIPIFNDGYSVTLIKP